MAKDYYRILGVSKEATTEEIKKAYKKLARQYHPDNKETGNEERFKEINEAAAVLADTDKRGQYDQFGDADAFKRSSGFSGYDFSEAGFGDFASFDFGDIFDRFFGGGVSGFSRGSRRGRDLRAEIEISLEEVASGVTKNLVIAKLDACSRCEGTGAQSGSDVVRCPDCHGSGTLKQARRTPFGIFATSSPCRRCEGSGEVVEHPCEMCDGTGQLEKEKKIQVKVPAGVENGMKLRIAGEGEAGERGTPAGDLYIIVHVKEHGQFTRKGNDIHVEAPISVVQAMLGDEIEVPTLNGTAVLRIPPGTQPGTVFRMKGRGLPSMHGYGEGSEFVRIDVEIPKSLSRRQKELLKEFAEASKDKGLFRRMFE
ncbi:molecular chaperone DnaJ [Candidatus Woesearchaeota archaeon]|nr:molecular chaperone DnaJ [Candidatus Woesearchaeota archaeon]